MTLIRRISARRPCLDIVSIGPVTMVDGGAALDEDEWLAQQKGPRQQHADEGHFLFYREPEPMPQGCGIGAVCGTGYGCGTTMG